MSENASDVDYLESIIKIEPEEFETIQEKKKTADVLESNYAEPSALAEPNNNEPVTIDVNLDEIRSADSLETLARKGNEGKVARDPHSCCFCKKVFAYRRAVKDHLERFHLKTRKAFCDQCPKIFFTKVAIIRHMRTAHRKEKFACNICDYKTARKDHLKIHKLIHTAKTECPICSKQVASLKIHMQCHKPKESCSICRKEVPRRNMTRHMKTHALQECGDCEEKFESSEELRSHKLRRHYEGKLYECHCGAIYQTKSSLWTHKQSHNEEEKTCDVCKKRFSSTRILKIHLEKQHGQSKQRVIVLNTSGPFICDKCGWKLSARSSFQNHISIHRKATFFCDLCPLSFKQKSYLVKHLKIIHLKLRPFQCDVCPHKASSRGNLESHKLRHGSKKKCRVCHKCVFNMSAHLKTHIQEKCPMCSKMGSKDNLRKHMKTHKKAH